MVEGCKDLVVRERRGWSMGWRRGDHRKMGLSQRGETKLA